MSLFRRRLTCFYCGHPSADKWNRGLRSFACEQCEAVNFLDEKGDITDPPVPPTPKEIPRYITPPEVSFYQPKYESDVIFCGTCLRNQHIWKETLASHERDETLDQRRALLEKQYPQVCRDCKPRVEKKLQEAQYLAKADHLRRLTMKTRQRQAWLNRQRTWKDVFLFIFGLLWWASFIVEVGWHLLGLLPISAVQEEVSSYTFANPAGLIRALCTMESQLDCLARWELIEKIGLSLRLASVWWHPKLSDKLHSSSARLSGYRDYFFTQLFALCIRALIWWILQGAVDEHIWGRVPVRAVHGAALAFSVISSVVGLTRVQTSRYTPDFLKEAPPRLELNEDQTHTPKPDFRKSETHVASTFPISALALQDPTPDIHLDPGYATGSETDADETRSIATTATEDMMDWTPGEQPTRRLAPSQSLFQDMEQNPRSPRYPLRSTEPSPFRGTLPPAPEPPLHRLLKPKPPVFKATSEKRKENFFAEVMGRDRNINPADYGGAVARRKDYELAEGKMRLPESPDTGLENLFSSSFQLDENPKPRKWQDSEGRKRTVVGHQPGEQQNIGLALWAVGVVGLLACIFGFANIILPGFYGSIARGVASVWRS
jgi:hypothetical protein